MLRSGDFEEKGMRFGLFGSAQARRAGPDTDSSQGFRDFIDNNVEAEALGYYSTFLVEHHFTGFGQVSASLNLLTWLGARTRHLRLGTAVLVLPWHNPVLLAEQAATLDLLSGGRLDFGVGKGYRYNEFAGFCLPMEEADERFEESLDVLTKAFVSETPFSHRGKYWQFEDVVVEPPTAQKPHPPFWMGAGSPSSVRQVAERGYNMLLGQHSLAEEILDQVAQFRGEVEARGRVFDPMHVAVARAVHIAKDAADKEAAVERRYQGHMRINALAKRPDGDTRDRFKSDDEEARFESAESALFGTPDEIMRKLERLRMGGVEYVIINFGGSRENIRRFARDIMPAFADEPAFALAGK
jgi:alkanesulfonate monooxygenase SsuD/methylene tetrahydromethanopterin reductase-like flavin-dependent oxidoreductase (luciferase family)